MIIYDFLGMDSMTKNPFERIVNYLLNWIWSRDRFIMSAANRKSIFIGEPEDIPDKKFGFLLPNRREYAKSYFTFIDTSFDLILNRIRTVQLLKKNLAMENFLW